ncbi:MAG: histidine phosphatase family protein [Paracoccaceae bacterium]
MIRLGLIRHGPTAWNRAGQIQGRSDIPLDDEARAELDGLTLPAPWDQADLVSSPLARAVETAELVTGRAPRTVRALTEMDWGDWEGKRGVDMLADPATDYRHIEDWGWDYRPPNGESVGDLRDRLLPWISGLQTDTLAVCHIGIMRVILAVAHSWDFDGPAPFKVKRRRIFGLTVADGKLVPDAEPVRLIARDV